MPPAGCIDAAAAERGDVIAYLTRRAANAAAVATASREGSEMREAALDRRRQCEVIIGDIEAGLHCGLAQVMADLVASVETHTFNEEIAGGD